MYIPIISTTGFSKLDYYLEESLIESFPLNMSKYVSMDTWVYIILCRINTEKLQLLNPNINDLCDQIYFSTCDLIEKPESYKTAVEYIKAYSLIQWLEN